MGLDTLVRNGVALANKLTGSLQVSVSHEAFSSKDKYNAPTYAAAVPRMAIVDEGAKIRRKSETEVIFTKAHVTFLSPVPVALRDRLTLPDGLTGPIVDVAGGGNVDPTTGQSYFTEAWIGE